MFVKAGYFAFCSRAAGSYSGLPSIVHLPFWSSDTTPGALGLSGLAEAAAVTVIVKVL